jgi:phage anti-repressor protein
MKELIKITEQNGRQAVSARELHRFLSVTERFSSWFERQLQYGFMEGVDYVGCKEFNTLANQELTDYALSIDCAKELSMLQRTERGKQARQYFIACEQKLKEVAKPLSQAEILVQTAQLLLEQEKRMQAIETKVAAIAERQEQAEQELKLIPVSTNPVKELTMRDNIRQLVNKYCKATGLMQQFVWDRIYSDLLYRYHIDVKHSGKGKNESWLDVAERRGCMQDIYDIVSSMIDKVSSSK